ncbi:hypothetical protein ACHAPT_013430 [Fusarium lateritium]
MGSTDIDAVWGIGKEYETTQVKHESQPSKDDSPAVDADPPPPDRTLIQMMDAISAGVNGAWRVLSVILLNPLVAYATGFLGLLVLAYFTLKYLTIFGPIYKSKARDGDSGTYGLKKILGHFPDSLAIRVIMATLDMMCGSQDRVRDRWADVFAVIDRFRQELVDTRQIIDHLFLDFDQAGAMLRQMKQVAIRLIAAYER